MCARAFEIYSEADLYSRYPTGSRSVSLNLAPVYNLCPTQESPVLGMFSGQRRFVRMRWQLVPAAEPMFSTKLATINARSETVFESRLFRDIVIRQRCIIPLSGFFEWKSTGGSRRPFKIQLRDAPIMSVAGIWETWHPGSGEARQSFSILTTAANGFMQSIHHRMPVILDRSQEEDWLDPKNQNQTSLRKLLQPCPDVWMDAVEVSTLVNSARNNSAAVLEPVSSMGIAVSRRLFND